MARLVNIKNLNAVVATGAGATENTHGHFELTITIIATSVTTGATIDLEGSPDGTNWVQLTTRNVTADGNTADITTGAHRFFRANVTARTDGTYTVWIAATGHSGVGE